MYLIFFVCCYCSSVLFFFFILFRDVEVHDFSDFALTKKLFFFVLNNLKVP